MDTVNQVIALCLGGVAITGMITLVIMGILYIVYPKFRRWYDNQWQKSSFH